MDDQDRASELTILRRRLTTYGAVAGGIVTFLAVGVFDELLKILAGIAVGGVTGLLLWTRIARARRDRFADELGELSRPDLQKTAGQFDIEGRSSMTKEELAEAVISRTIEDEDPTNEVVLRTVEEAEDKIEEAATKAKRRMRRRRRKRSPVTGKPAAGAGAKAR